MADNPSPGVTGRLRKASVSIADTVLNFNPQPGMWAATGTAIAHAPTIEELRQPIAGGENVAFTAHGHSARTITTSSATQEVLFKTPTKTTSFPLTHTQTSSRSQAQNEAAPESPSLATLTTSSAKHSWAITIKHGLSAFWKFFKTPTGFLITIYGLNIVAWGAMLFFLLLNVAPAMNHPSADADNSSRKIWLEIDSQILNALFCVTGFGLAPWRFRDLWFLVRVRLARDKSAMARLASQNASWFRSPAWATEESDVEETEGALKQTMTFTGKRAPATKLWKLDFVVWMMVLNTVLQAVLSAFMWGYNRLDRPSWATGTFIGLGCGVSLLAGLMSWWEGRKVKKIEGPVLKVIEDQENNSAV